MSKIFQTFLQIQNTAGTNAKKEILRKNMSPVIRQIFEDTYGSQKYYLKIFVPDGEYGDLTIDNDYITFHDTLMKLANREVTGDTAERLLQKTVALYDYESQEILYKIIERNLKIGISLDNFLDVIGEKESKFDVASALYIKHKDNIVKVGSGLSKEQRLRWFDHPEEIIGKTITVQYFEETQDSKTKAYSLRFPVLKYVYENGRNV